MKALIMSILSSWQELSPPRFPRLRVRHLSPCPSCDLCARAAGNPVKNSLPLIRAIRVIRGQLPQFPHFSTPAL